MIVAVDKAAISALINKYNDLSKRSKLTEFSEADVGSKFILPLFEALGWDVRNIDEFKEQRRTLTGPVDYSLRVRGVPRLVVEIKKFVEDLDGKRVVRGKEETYPYQATRYAWHLKVDWCVLTNFRELRLYYAHTQKPEDGIVFKIRYDRYADADFENLSLLSKESVVSGKLDTLEKRRTRNDVDREILENLVECRKKLVHSILGKHPKLNLDEVKESVQKILDRILVIRVSEDQGIIGADSLWRELESWRSRGLPTPFMRSLKSLFRDFDEVYNSKLFEPHLCEDLKIDNDVLEFILSEDALYGYNFDLIDADVLGAIYEDYIGHILAEGDEGVEIIESRTARKKSGIYYTPTYIVDYIVRNTLGEVLNTCETLEEVSKIRVLDPACGSGSFLIKAFDVFKEWYDDYNRRVEENTTGDNWNRVSQISNVETKILTENLYGVDLDPQAVEIASVNLMLKALKKGKRLPLIIDQNIKCGNSLIEGLEEELIKYFGDNWKNEKPFNWSEEFSQIFKDGGFDVIIGNPPHGAKMSKNERAYYEDHYEIAKGYKNTASLFLESSYKLLKQNGLLGFVIPKSLTFSQRWKIVRDYLIKNVQILTLADVSKAFQRVLLEQIAVILRKNIEKYCTYKGIKLYWNEYIETYTIPLSICSKMDNLPIHIDRNSLNIFKKIFKKSIKFSCISKTFRGLPIQSKVVKVHQDDYESIIRGDDIQRYANRHPRNFISKRELGKKTEKINNLRKTKIISQRIIAHVLYPSDHIIIMSTLDTTGTLNVDTVENTIVTDIKYDIRYPLAILNSSLISWFTYIFIFNKAIRTMDFDNYYIGKIPLYPANKEEQKGICILVDKIIELKPKYNAIVGDFERYWAPIFDELLLKHYYDKLSVSDTEILDRRARGTVQKVYIKEDSDWLILSADYFKTEKGQRQRFTKVPILKCRFEDEALRKFLLHIILNNKKRLGTGNLSSKILTIPVPRFDKDPDKNLELIKEIMDSYLKAIRRKEKLEEEIKKIDQEIDNKIYQLYDLTDEEVAIIENTFKS